MSKDKQHDGYHEIPVDKSIYLGDEFGPVSYSFLKFYTVTLTILIGASTAIACLTTWWQQLFMLLYFGSAWYVSWGATAIVAGLIYWKFSRRQKRLTRERRDADRRRKVEDGLIKFGK